MVLEEFLKTLKKESEDIERLNNRTYFNHFDKFFKMIAYDGNRLDKKHNLMITPYLQYIAATQLNDFRAGLNKSEIEEIIESVKAEIDCMIFKIEQGKG